MIVVDSSVVVAAFKAEPDATELLERLIANPDRVMSVANWLEAAIVCDRISELGGSAIFDAIVSELQLKLLAVTAEQADLARKAYAAYGKKTGHPAELNYGDCFAYALAKSLDAPLLFKGEDFAQTDVRRA